MSHQLGSFIISLLILILGIASIIGLCGLTTIAFTAKTSNDTTYTVTGFSKTKMGFSKLTVVLLWIQICLSVLGVLWALGHLNSKT